MDLAIVVYLIGLVDNLSFTSGYTIRALESAIDDLKEIIRKSGSRDLISIFQERVEELERQLEIINKLSQE